MTQEPKLWRDMTPEEKGALLLAHHEGKVIQSLVQGAWMKVAKQPLWSTRLAYRVKPEPIVEAVTLYGPTPNGSFVAEPYSFDDYPHRITYAVTNGEPDPASIKMERLK